MAELAWTSFDKLAKIYKLQVPKNGKIHPTQKPVKLYDWLLHNYAKPNDLILDTHLGSGSSRIAAYKGGFNFVGFEIDCDYFNAQEKRFNEFKSQLRLF
jgi:site-specific DNA-methyltransferase (adenine-specific)